jgi:hypothetical protein
LTPPILKLVYRLRIETALRFAETAKIVGISIVNNPLGEEKPNDVERKPQAKRKIWRVRLT